MTKSKRRGTDVKSPPAFFFYKPNYDTYNRMDKSLACCLLTIDITGFFKKFCIATRTKKKDTLTLVFLFALRWRKRCSDKGYVPQCINYINPYGFNQSRSGRANNRALFIAMSNVRHVDALYMEP